VLPRLLGRVRRNLSIPLAFLAALVLFVGAGIWVNGFASAVNARSILIQTAILAVVAAGQTFVILGGGIDLSVPWIMTVAGVVAAVRAPTHGAVETFAIVLALGALIGLANGIGVTVLQVPPIVMTLATNVMLSGAIVLYVGPSPPSTAPAFASGMLYGSVAGIPGYVLVILVTAAIATVLLTMTTFGRMLYALGTSLRVSRFAGVRTNRVLVGTYILSAVAACIAGIALTGYVGSPFLGMGDPYQFASIAAVIVGGASILGGSGHYLGTLAGALLLTVLLSLLHTFSLGQGAINIFYGATILVAVWLVSPQLRRTLSLGHRARHPIIDEQPETAKSLAAIQDDVDLP
jgi:ribose transport system permease protein